MIEIQSHDLGNHWEFVARTEAFKTVNLLAKVNGTIIKRSFVEGEVVDKGQLLFQLDPASYQAALDSAKANLELSLASQDQAEKALTRGKELFPKGFISQADMDRMVNASQSANAAVAAARAQLESAKINLSLTRITAPFQGEISRLNYNVGNFVGPDSGPLATLIQVDPIYVNFQLDENSYLRYLKNTAEQEGEDSPYVLTLRLPNGDMYDQEGKLNYTDTQVDPTTGTINFRADFPNPQRIIRPGLFVTLIVDSVDTRPLPLVPQYAVQQSQLGKFVLVVNQDNIVSQRIIKTSRNLGTMWAIEEGLEPGETIVVEGLQKVREGSPVSPVLKKMDPITGVLSDTANNAEN